MPSKKDMSPEDKERLMDLLTEKARIKTEISAINSKYARPRTYRFKRYDRGKIVVGLNKWIKAIKARDFSIVKLDDSQIFELDFFKEKTVDAGFEELLAMIKGFNYKKGNVGSTEYTTRIVKRKLVGDRIRKLREQGVRPQSNAGRVVIAEAARFSSLCERYPALPWIRGFNLWWFQQCAGLFQSNFDDPKIFEVISTVVTTRY